MQERATQEVKGDQYPPTRLAPASKGSLMVTTNWFQVTVLLGGLILGGTIMDQCRYKGLEAKDIQQDAAIKSLQDEQQTVEIDNARTLSRIEEALNWIKGELRDLQSDRN